jgi:hypothetical protein
MENQSLSADRNDQGKSATVNPPYTVGAITVAFWQQHDEVLKGMNRLTELLEILKCRLDRDDLDGPDLAWLSSLHVVLQSPLLQQSSASTYRAKVAALLEHPAVLGARARNVPVDDRARQFIALTNKIAYGQ